MSGVFETLQERGFVEQDPTRLRQALQQPIAFYNDSTAASFTNLLTMVLAHMRAADTVRCTSGSSTCCGRPDRRKEMQDDDLEHINANGES